MIGPEGGGDRQYHRFNYSAHSLFFKLIYYIIKLSFYFSPFLDGLPLGPAWASTDLISIRRCCHDDCPCLDSVSQSQLVIEINFCKCGSSCLLAGEPSHRHVNNVLRRPMEAHLHISVRFMSLALCANVRVSPQQAIRGPSGVRRTVAIWGRAAFMEWSCTFCNHTIKRLVEGEREREKRERERESVFFCSQSDGQREIASFTESDFMLWCWAKRSPW